MEGGRNQTDPCLSCAKYWFCSKPIKKCVWMELLRLEMSVGHSRRVSVGCGLETPEGIFINHPKPPRFSCCFHPGSQTFPTGIEPPTPTNPSLETGKQSWRSEVPKPWQQTCSRWRKEAWQPEPFPSWPAEPEIGCGSVWRGAWNTPEILQPNSSPVEKPF